MRGMKSNALARRAGISVSYLSELETTEGMSPSAVVLCRIADALEVSVQYLLDLPDRLSVPIGGGPNLPLTLTQAKVRFQFADDEVALLKGIDYRGKRPQTVDDWNFLLGAIRRVVG